MEKKQQNRANDYVFGNTNDGFRNCYTTESLASRLSVSKKFIIAHRQRLPGAMKIGRIWRFDKNSVEKKLLSGNLF
ncbi:MAG: helix-turn-helix domain-containing protein [Chitinivibrionales bacterium]|nr:helix-turn-helix domain-containing protein [Chitinivibrionales bacterium]